MHTLAEELVAIRSDAVTPEGRTVLDAHVLRRVALAAADAADAAATTAMQAAVDSFERRRAAEAEAATLEGQLSEAAAPPPSPAGGKKGKADKGAAPYRWDHTLCCAMLRCLRSLNVPWLLRLAMEVEWCEDCTAA